LIGTTWHYLEAMLVGFKFSWIRLWHGILLAVLAGVLYSIYLLMSKKVLSQMDVLSFMTISILSSTVFLGIVCTLLDEPFFGFSDAGWSFYLFRRSYVNWQLGYQLVTLHNTCEPPGFHWVY
jgi:drug/metabolite transporter (DMT)-like permease